MDPAGDRQQPAEDRIYIAESTLPPHDDWSGLSAKERRKRQNRINQRNRRIRLRLQKQYEVKLPPRPRSTPSKAGLYSNSRHSGQQSGPSEKPSPSIYDIVRLFSPKDKQPRHDQPLSPVEHFPSSCVVEVWLMMPNTARREILIEQLAQVYNSYVMNCPRSHQLLTVTMMNVHRAFVSNMLTLGLTWEFMKDDSISPISTLQPSRQQSQLPESLRPTSLQRSKPHHAWLDLFPCSVMRNNLLQAGEAGEDWDDDALCIDLMGYWVGGSTSPYGLIIWGDPSNPQDWEFTEGFLQKWGWTLRGCDDLIRATNRWREKRGEHALFASSFLLSSRQ